MRTFAQAYSISICCVTAIVVSGCFSTPKPSVSFQKGAVMIQYEETFGGRPIIEGVINGVRGKFLIDTGADDPVLTMKAVRECGIRLTKERRRAEFLGDEEPGEFAVVDGKLNIQIQGATITWKDVSVASGLGSDIFFGVIDYRTLKAARAIINVKERTLTISP